MRNNTQPARPIKAIFLQLITSLSLLLPLVSGAQTVPVIPDPSFNGGQLKTLTFNSVLGNPLDLTLEHVVQHPESGITTIGSNHRSTYPALREAIVYHNRFDDTGNVVGTLNSLPNDDLWGPYIRKVKDTVQLGDVTYMLVEYITTRGSVGSPRYTYDIGIYIIPEPTSPYAARVIEIEQGPISSINGTPAIAHSAGAITVRRSNSLSNAPHIIHYVGTKLETTASPPYSPTHRVRYARLNYEFFNLTVDVAPKELYAGMLCQGLDSCEASSIQFGSPINIGSNTPSLYIAGLRTSGGTTAPFVMRTNGSGDLVTSYGSNGLLQISRTGVPETVVDMVVKTCGLSTCQDEIYLVGKKSRTCRPGIAVSHWLSGGWDQTIAGTDRTGVRCLTAEGLNRFDAHAVVRKDNLLFIAGAGTYPQPGCEDYICDFDMDATLVSLDLNAPTTSAANAKYQAKDASGLRNRHSAFYGLALTSNNSLTAVGTAINTEETGAPGEFEVDKRLQAVQRLIFSNVGGDTLFSDGFED